MPVSLQSKLLRVLNNGEFQPLGSTRTLRTDARILSSTNRDLQQMIRQGQFREDLYYRINVINVQIPPLRERLEDLPLLIDHFLERLGKRRRKGIHSVSSEVLQRLRCYDFPGNIRELDNAIEHAYVLCAGNVIRVEDLPEHIREATKAQSRRLPPDSEEAIVRDTLRRTGGNRAKAARELGMHRSTFWRKLKRLGIAE
jgi:DNA-binding NtrC family response regulator